MAEYPIRVEVPFKEKASRLEAIIRIFYSLVLLVILVLWSIPAYVGAALQWFNILILGKRNRALHNFVAGYFKFSIRAESYFAELTDEKPPISFK